MSEPGKGTGFCSCSHARADHGKDASDPESTSCAMNTCACVAFEEMQAPNFLVSPHPDQVRDELWAKGCHLDVYDRRVGAGEAPQVVAADVIADWETKQRRQASIDAELDARSRSRRSGKPSVVVQQTTPAMASAGLTGVVKRKR